MKSLVLALALIATAAGCNWVVGVGDLSLADADASLDASSPDAALEEESPQDGPSVRPPRDATVMSDDGAPDAPADDATEIEVSVADAGDAEGGESGDDSTVDAPDVGPTPDATSPPDAASDGA